MTGVRSVSDCASTSMSLPLCSAVSVHVRPVTGMVPEGLGPGVEDAVGPRVTGAGPLLVDPAVAGGRGGVGGATATRVGAGSAGGVDTAIGVTTTPATMTV